MEYKTPSEARDLPGLRIALTAGLPAPWSMTARFMFDVKGIDYVPVLQVAGGVSGLRGSKQLVPSRTAHP